MSSTATGIHRRSFLLAGAAGGAALGLAPVRALGRSARGGVPDKARNVIFMVADGMSTGTLTLAHLARRTRDGRGTNWVGLWNTPGVRRAMATTHSADSLVTDSAAGASVWGSGFKVPNGALNIDETGRQHLPILVRARQAGKGTGLVTTTRVTHATPAGFVSNMPHRDFEPAIAAQILSRGVDVVLGGGAKHFPEEMLARHAQYRVVRTGAELRTAGSAGALLGLFAEDHLPFELDRPAEVPTLAQMTGAAIERLSKASNEGFVLQVEGGRVDHAAHANDAAALVTDQLAFDDAIGVVTEFASNRDDTLVVITTDHGNANPGLTLYGQRASEGLSGLLKVKGSYDAIEARASAIMGEGRPGGFGAALLAAIGELTGVTLDADEQRMLQAARRSERTAAFAAMNSATCVLGQILANHFGVSFISPNHTGDLVEVTAFGPGSAKLAAFIDNTDLHGLMVTALELPEGELLPGMEQVLVPRRSKGE